MKQTEAEFLKDLDKRLWTAADKLRSNLDAAVYKHVVLGLIFLKYVSDAFNERREELQAQFRDPKNDYYLGDDDALIAEELEVRDYYTEKNVFWVPALARWDFLKAHAKVAPGTEIEVKNGKRTTYKFVSLGRLLDDALEAIEKDNPKLKNVLNKDYARLQVDAGKLGELIDLGWSFASRCRVSVTACPPPGSATPEQEVSQSKNGQCHQQFDSHRNPNAWTQAK